MRSHTITKTLSWLLLAAGVAFLFRGTREFLGSILGQEEVADNWQPPAAAPQTAPRNSPPLLAGDPVARLSIPRLDAQMYVVEGTAKKELRRGPGHLTGTVLPGAGGNCVIAGHRDTHFRVLKDIRKGDDIILETPEGEFLYRVRNLSIVSPGNTAPLDPTRNSELNLITCYPFYYVGPAPKRFIVRAELAAKVHQTVRTAAGPRSGG